MDILLRAVRIVCIVCMEHSYDCKKKYKFATKRL